MVAPSRSTVGITASLGSRFHVPGSTLARPRLMFHSRQSDSRPGTRNLKLGTRVRCPVAERAGCHAGRPTLLGDRLDQRLDISVREGPPAVAPGGVLERLRHVIVDEEAVK